MMKGSRSIGFTLTALVLGAAVVFAMGLLNLPLGQVSSTHGPWNAGTMDSTIDITLGAVPDGYDVMNGTYAGWCMEDNYRPNFQAGTLVTLVDSTDDPANFPACEGYNLIPWDKVNYLLNNRSGTVQDVQVALWLLTGTYGGTFPLTPAAQAMFADANANGGGFAPSAGQIVAVLLCGDGIGPGGFQDTLIEVLVPPDDEGDSCTPGFWRNTRQRLSEWHLAGYDPGDSFDAAMGGCVSTGLTMGQAVNQNGGGERKLIRFGTASLLNAGHPDVDHGLTTDEVIAIFCDAYATGDWNVFDGLYDSEECPL